MSRLAAPNCWLALAAALLLSSSATGQEPADWDDPFHTFSIAAVDPETGESGVAVTTRVPCVGNAVPWVRAGVGAVATQSWTRVEYGPELLEMLAEGLSAEEALRKAVAADSLAARRQVGVIGLSGGSAAFTGGEAWPWAGHRSGPDYVTQGNVLVGPDVLEAVASTFEASAGAHRHLADRLIEALAAGQRAGGDARKGRLQSAAVTAADPRPERSRRPDGVTVNINICEHPTPVAELRRVYDRITQTLGFRALQQYRGRDIWQLKVILHALGHFRAGEKELQSDEGVFVYDQEVIDAVDAFRAAEGLSTPAKGSPAGLVDGETVRHLWTALERSGKAAEVREALKGSTAARR